MKIIHYGDGTRWGDPNARWGDPSYLLEPGDPGYVSPVPVNQPPKKGKPMTRNPYWPRKVADQVTLLTVFAVKLPNHAATVGLTNPQRDAAVADARWLAYVLGIWLPAVRTFGESATDAATEAQRGDGSGVMALPTFTAPGLPTGVVPVNTGALDRFFAIVQTIRDASGYTDAIGSDLGIVGDELTEPDYDTLAPPLKVKVTPAGVFVDWTFGKYRKFLDMIEIQVDRGTGWEMLAFDTTPGYTDTFALPATLTKWKYRAIYRVGDQRVGQWSAEQSVTVGG